METIEYGALVLIPPIFIIVFALITRRSFLALLLGSILTYIIMYGLDSYGPIMDLVYGVLMDEDVIWTVLITGIFGSLIYLFQKSRGVEALSRVISKFATNARRSMIGAWLVGLIIFVGDMLNIMTVGVVMKKITDKYKVPREMLAYIMDSTAAPVAVLAPVSSWAAFFIAILMAQPEVNFTSDSEVYNYLQIIPFLFYPMAAVIIVFLLSYGLLPKVGPMKKAFERAANTGKVYSDASKKYNLDEEEELPSEEQKIKPKVYNLLIPLGVLVFLAIYTGDILMGAIFAVITCALIYMGTRIMNLNTFASASLQGFVSMVPMMLIIVGAFMARDALMEIKLPEYVVANVAPLMDAALVPAITFLTVAILAFVTSSSWGIPAVVVPIMVPLAASLGAPMLPTLAAIVSGASFGSHACFYSDATVITSAIAKIENTEHAFSQFPYALLGAGVATIGFLIAGFVMV